MWKQPEESSFKVAMQRMKDSWNTERQERRRGNRWYNNRVSKPWPCNKQRYSDDDTTEDFSDNDLSLDETEPEISENDNSETTEPEEDPSEEEPSENEEEPSESE